MLRTAYLKKYKDKQPIDIDEKYLKSDDNYIINNYRPLNEKELNKIPQNKFNIITDDILYNQNISNLIFSSNGKEEIKLLKKGHESMTKKIFCLNKEEKKSDPSDIFMRRKKLEAISLMEKEVKIYKEHKNEYKSEIEKENNDFYKRLNEEKKKKRNDEIISKNKIKIDRYNKIFESLKEKIINYNTFTSYNNNEYIELKNDLIKSKDLLSTLSKSNQEINNDMYTTISIEKNNSKNKFYSQTKDQDLTIKENTAKMNCTNSNRNYFGIMREKYLKLEKQKIISQINLPDITQIVNNVYSRLYYNLVFKSKVDSNSQIHQLSEKAIKQFEEKNKIKITDFYVNSQIGSGGKDFTLKITDEMKINSICSLSSGPKKVIKIIKNKGKTKDVDLSKLNNDSELINNNHELVHDINLLNIKDPLTGDTFLHRSTTDNILDLVKYLIAKGVNINSKNHKGQTSLHIAIMNKNKEIIQELLNNGANIDISDKYGHNAVFYADLEIKKYFNLENKLMMKKWNQSNLN